MGYTNYWHQDMDFTDKQWKAVQEEVEYMQEIGDSTISVIRNDENEIAINGNSTCETFVLTRYKPDTPDYEGQDLTFNCCKTRELPYDIYVWHLLVFCTGMINNTDKFSISRDR